MDVAIADFDLQRLRKDFLLFPDQFENDPWVMYHGTSGFNADSIERDGFGSGTAGDLRVGMERIARAFETLNWRGLDGSSYAVLKPFSLSCDFGESDVNPVYFAETSRRAVLYASRDFAGGEKLRTVRRCLEQLSQYAERTDIRQEHHEQLNDEYCRFAEAGNGATVPATDVDLCWLEDELALLKRDFAAAFEADLQHSHGVVYAVRANESDLKHLKLSAMGIKSEATIPPERIVGKVIIPADYVEHRPGRCIEEIKRLLSFSTGIYKALSCPSVT